MELQTERLSLRPMSDAELQTLMEAVRPRDAEPVSYTHLRAHET